MHFPGIPTPCCHRAWIIERSSFVLSRAKHFGISQHAQQKAVHLGNKALRRVLTQSMYVPSDSFGGQSPERLASQQMRKLFTFCAARIVLAQLEGSGRGALGAFNAEHYQTLADHLQNEKMGDPEEWLELLMKRDLALALRVMEVRAAYSAEGFEWDTLQRISRDDVAKLNARLMREHVSKTFQMPATTEGPAGEGTEDTEAIE